MDQQSQFNTGVPLANQKADDFVLRHQGLIPIIKSLGEQLSVGSTRLDL